MLYYRDVRFDTISMSFGIRNFPDRASMLQLLPPPPPTPPPPPDQPYLIFLPISNQASRQSARLSVRNIAPLTEWLNANASADHPHRYEIMSTPPSPVELAAVIESCGFDMAELSSLAAGAASIHAPKLTLKHIPRHRRATRAVTVRSFRLPCSRHAWPLQVGRASAKHLSEAER
jgi:hypothetical protein